MLLNSLFCSHDIFSTDDDMPIFERNRGKKKKNIGGRGGERRGGERRGVKYFAEQKPRKHDGLPVSFQTKSIAKSSLAPWPMGFCSTQLF